jgi:hypothetical protein
MRPISERRKTGGNLPRSAKLSSQALYGVANRLDFGPLVEACVRLSKPYRCRLLEFKVNQGGRASLVASHPRWRIAAPLGKSKIDVFWRRDHLRLGVAGSKDYEIVMVTRVQILDFWRCWCYSYTCGINYD